MRIYDTLHHKAVHTCMFSDQLYLHMHTFGFFMLCILYMPTCYVYTFNFLFICVIIVIGSSTTKVYS